MELASILLMTIIAVVLLLQVIALVQIAGMRKALGEIKEIKATPAPAPAPSSDRFQRKGGDFRRNEKRPYQDQRPRPVSPSRAPATPAPAAPPAVAADPVETSLRDINLRLKNAERDQDFARKKIQENLSGDRDQQQRGYDRSDRDRGDRGNDRNRDGGDRNRGDRNRGGRDGNRDRNRNSRQDTWQDRNRPSPQQPVAPTAAAAQNSPDELPTFEKKPFLAAPVVATPAMSSPVVAPVEQDAPAAVFQPATAPVDQAPVDFGSDDEGMEHGRKVLVKRRPLRDEENESSDSQTMVKEEISSEAPESLGEIQFGRRKGR